MHRDSFICIMARLTVRQLLRRLCHVCSIINLFVTRYVLGGRLTVGVEIFRNGPDKAGSLPNLLYNDYWVTFPR
jgi:hypothetical protein